MRSITQRSNPNARTITNQRSIAVENVVASKIISKNASLTNVNAAFIDSSDILVDNNLTVTDQITSDSMDAGTIMADTQLRIPVATNNNNQNSLSGVLYFNQTTGMLMVCDNANRFWEVALTRV